jgi:hypothetical protein
MKIYVGSNLKFGQWGKRILKKVQSDFDIVVSNIVKVMGQKHHKNISKC